MGDYTKFFETKTQSKEAKKEKVNISLVILDKGGNVVLSMKEDNAAVHTMKTAQKKAK